MRYLNFSPHFTWVGQICVFMDPYYFITIVRPLFYSWCRSLGYIITSSLTGGHMINVCGAASQCASNSPTERLDEDLKAVVKCSVSHS